MPLVPRTAAPVVLAVLFAAGAVPAATAQCESAEIVTLASSDVHAFDEFGRGADIDGTVAVVGAPRDENGYGAAYVYEFDGAAWVFRARLTGTDTALGDEFGYDVAIEGDLVAVGAHMPSPAERPGAVYVFERPAGAWTDMTQTARLTAADGLPNDNFGHAVDIDGGTIVVGAYLNDAGASNTGAAYVYAAPAAAWTDATETAKLIATDADANDQFGIDVSISGDAIIAGADRDSDVLYQAGAAYVFVMPGGGWANMGHTAKLTVSSPVDLDRFGLSVGISGETAVVGAWGNDDAANKAGAAFVFDRPAGGWSDMNETAVLTASDAAAGDHLGWSVAIEGPVVVAGAPANLFDGSGFGAAYLYMRPAGGWTNATEDAAVASSAPAEDDEFATTVAVGDRVLAVGARFRDTGGFANAGAAFLYGGAADCNDDHSLDLCEIVGGTGTDLDGDGVLDSCQVAACPADTNGDGRVDVDDLVAVIQAWGVCGGGCAADTNDDMVVDVNDLNAVILGWGDCV